MGFISWNSLFDFLFTPSILSISFSVPSASAMAAAGWMRGHVVGFFTEAGFLFSYSQERIHSYHAAVILPVVQVFGEQFA